MNEYLGQMNIRQCFVKTQSEVQGTNTNTLLKPQVNLFLKGGFLVKKQLINEVDVKV